MSLKYGGLCVVLFLVVLLLAIKSYHALTDPLELVANQGTAKKSEASAESPPTEKVAKGLSPIGSYRSIAEKNIFNPERKDFQATGSESVTKPSLRPQVILYGVTIAENYQSASVVNPGRPLKKGEREQMTLKLGERIGDYKLTKVSADRITLEAEGDTFEVLLYDPRMPKKRIVVKTESKPATVTNAQASSAMGSDLKRDGKLPSPSPSPATLKSTPRPPVRREATGGTGERIPERTSPSQTPEPEQPPAPSTIPGPQPTPTYLPPTMAPTTIPPPMTPTPITPPPDMGRPISEPPGGN